MAIDPKYLAALQIHTKYLRNICILAHVDHGKTTLADYLLASNGIISQKMAGKARFMDSREDEQERRITMKSSCISLAYDPTVAKLPTRNVKTSRRYLINLIDSPGHIDFSGEVSTATRLSDGALVLVDVLEGICTQTTTVLRQAWEEGVKPVLVLNKMDKLIVDLNMTPMEAHQHLMQIIEQINTVTSSFVVTHAMESQEDNEHFEIEEKDERSLTFAPETGNVVFCSAYDCWAFSIPQMARFFSKTMGMSKKILSEFLYGDFFYDPKSKTIKKHPTEKATEPLFVQYILNSIWKLYKDILIDEGTTKTIQKRTKKLQIKVPIRELTVKDFRARLQSVMARWMPIPDAILGMVIDKLPSPLKAQKYRMKILWPFKETSTDSHRSFATSPRSVISSAPYVEDVMKCDPNAEHVMVYITKMISVEKAVVDAAHRDTTDSARVRHAYVRGKHKKPQLDISGESDKTPDTISDGSDEGGTQAEDKGQAQGEVKYDTGPSAIEQESETNAEIEIPETPELEAQPEPEAQLEPDALPEVHLEPEAEAQHVLEARPEQRNEQDEMKVSADEDEATQLRQNGDSHESSVIDLKAEVAEDDEGRFIAFCRIFCGTLRKDSVLHIFGPKFDPNDPNKEQHVVSVKGFDLYQFMGSSLHLLDSVPSGNVFGIGGLDKYVLKTATVSTMSDCIPFQDLRYQAQPILRVAIQPKRAGHLRALKKGLRLLGQADPNVGILIQADGELVLIANGEVHLQRCILDLKTRFTKGVRFDVSEPIVQFRETIVRKAKPDAKNEEKPPREHDEDSKDNVADRLEERQEDPYLLKVITPNRLCYFAIRAIPLPENVTGFLFSNPEKITRIVEEIKNLSSTTTSASSKDIPSPRVEIEQDQGSDDNSNSLQELQPGASKETISFFKELREKFKTAPKSQWKWRPKDVDSIWSFGPRRNGPNILMNRTEKSLRSFCMTSNLSPATESSDEQDPETVEFNRILTKISAIIINGFALATSAGPLMEEPMMGVCFVIEEMQLEEWNVERDGPDSRGPLSGQVMSTLNTAFRDAFSLHSPRIMQSMYKATLLSTVAVLRKLYGLITQRHGRITGECIRGTTQFVVEAVMPVCESFGFSTVLRTRTSGVAQPQLMFSHWELIDEDPFWKATTEEELDDYGTEDKTLQQNRARSIMNKVRKRKGLSVEEVIVSAPDKERTRKF